MVNVNKLKGKIVEKGMSVEALAEKIEMNKSTLYRKLNNLGETFTVKECDDICVSLELTRPEAVEIFFAQFVA